MHTVSFVTEGYLKNRHIKLFKRDERDILSEQADQCYTVFKIELNTSLKLLNEFNIKLCLKKINEKFVHPLNQNIFQCQIDEKTSSHFGQLYH